MHIRQSNHTLAPLFLNIWYHYLMTFALFLIVWLIPVQIIISLIETGIGTLNDFMTMVIYVVMFYGAARYVWSWQEKVPELHYAELRWKKKTLGIWAPEGSYFLPPGFYFFRKEQQSSEIQDVKTGIFDIQDKNGKSLKGGINGDWRIVDHHAYELMDEHQIVGNLQSLLKRTAMRIYGDKEYWSEIIGKDLHSMILNDTTFNQELGRMGIAFRSLIVEVISADLALDNQLAQRDRIIKGLKSAYPTGYIFTPAELNNFEEIADVQQKLVQKFIGLDAKTLLKIK